MAVLGGCEEKYKTPVLEERICPQCGAEVEVFASKGRIVEDSACECGYVFQAQQPEPLIVEKKEKES